jgi:outer membrane protein OmpA-like peptidoglycan-associated protein
MNWVNLRQTLAGSDEHETEGTMTRTHGVSVMTAGLIGFLTLSYPAFGDQVSRQQILEALTAQPEVARFRDKLSRIFSNREYALAAIYLEIDFDFNSAAITGKAEPQLDELGAALTDPRLKGATISIGGHTDGVGGDAFNKKLSERRAAMVKEYLVDNFHLSAANLRTVGYGKTRPKNQSDLTAPENRRVEIVNLAPPPLQDSAR